MFLFLYQFQKSYLGGAKSWKNVFQYLKYELRYDILNMDQFVLPL